MKAGSPSVPKRKWTCHDGPMAGHVLCLASGFTAWLNFNGRVGRYVRSKERVRALLVWEPK